MSPARNLKRPATAIIAALSVVNLNSGMKVVQPRFSPSEAIRLRRPELADTPPPMATCFITCLLHGFQELVHEHVYQGLLERGADIGHIVLHEVGVLLQMVTHKYSREVFTPLKL